MVITIIIRLTTILETNSEDKTVTTILIITIIIIVSLTHSRQAHSQIVTPIITI